MVRYRRKNRKDTKPNRIDGVFKGKNSDNVRVNLRPSLFSEKTKFIIGEEFFAGKNGFTDKSFAPSVKKLIKEKFHRHVSLSKDPILLKEYMIRWQEDESLRRKEARPRPVYESTLWFLLYLLFVDAKLRKQVFGDFELAFDRNYTIHAYLGDGHMYAFDFCLHIHGVCRLDYYKCTLDSTLDAYTKNRTYLYVEQLVKKHKK